MPEAVKKKTKKNSKRLCRLQNSCSRKGVFGMTFRALLKTKRGRSQVFVFLLLKDAVSLSLNQAMLQNVSNEAFN